MDKLRQKIEKTWLFTDSVKLRLLAHLSEVSEADRSNLEATIDQFDRSMEECAQRLRSQVGQHMAGLKTDAATPEEQQKIDSASDAVWEGINLLTGTN